MGILSRLRARIERRFAGLKARLAVVVALVLLVPTSFAIIQAGLEMRDAQRRQIDNLERMLALVESQHRAVLRQTQHLLRTFANGPLAQSPRIVCERALRGEALQNPLYHSFARLDANGTIDCGSREDAFGINYADRYWWQELKRGGDVSLSESIARRSPEPGQTIVLAVPIRGPGGTLTGAVMTAMAVDQLISLPRNVVLPEGAVAAVVDRLGTVITTRGENEWATEQIGHIDAGLRGPSAPPIVIPAPDGREWRFLALPSTDPGMFTSVVVGQPVEHWGWFNSRFQLAVFLPTLILFLSVFVVWVATDVMITRHVLALASAVRRYRRSGDPIAVSLRGAPEELDDLAHALSDVTKRVAEREAQLNASLAEKNLLLREVHHRVKNNLQIVTSLLNLRAAGLASPVARRAMREAQLRIKSLAFVHRSLYEQEEVSSVALHEMLEDICPQFHELSEGLSSRVALRLELSPYFVSADQATPLALLVTELLSNAAKHAFPDDLDGTVTVSLVVLPDGRAVLSIADNGVGPPKEEAAAGPRRGLGTTLVEMLAKQLGATLLVENGGQGWKVSITFRSAER